jgi:hypothetical protein
MPGAYIREPSFAAPGFSDIDDRHILELVAQKIFLDALYAGRWALLRGGEKRPRRRAGARQRSLRGSLRRI